MKWRDTGVNGGEGSVTMNGSPGGGDPAAALAPQVRSWDRKYGEREARMKR